MPFMYIYYSYTDRSIAQLVLQKYHFADIRRLLCSFVEMGREFVCLQQITDNHCPLGMHPPSPPTNNELIKYLYAWRSGTLIRVCSNLCVVFSARRFSQKISFNINPLWSNLIKDSPLYSHPIFPKTQLETNWHWDRTAWLKNNVDPRDFLLPRSTCTRKLTKIWPNILQVSLYYCRKQFSPCWSAMS